jgi:hypothetical protein
MIEKKEENGRDGEEIRAYGVVWLHWNFFFFFFGLFCVCS